MTIHAVDSPEPSQGPLLYKALISQALLKSIDGTVQTATPKAKAKSKAKGAPKTKAKAKGKAKAKTVPKKKAKSKPKKAVLRAGRSSRVLQPEDGEEEELEDDEAIEPEVVLKRPASAKAKAVKAKAKVIPTPTRVRKPEIEVEGEPIDTNKEAEPVESMGPPVRRRLRPALIDGVEESQLQLGFRSSKMLLYFWYINSQTHYGA